MDDTEIRVELARIAATLEAQAAQLSEHMRRSDANEKAVAILEKTVVAHMARMNLVLAMIGTVGVALLGVIGKLIVS